MATAADRPVDPPVDPSATLRRTYARAAALLAGCMGLAVLAGWAFDMPMLRSVIPGAVQMKANTAIGMVLGALALWLAAAQSWPHVTSASLGRPHRAGDTLHGVVARGAALLVLLLGLATLSQYLMGWQLGIDELLVRDTAAAFNQTKGRMSPYSASAFAALGLALLLQARRGSAWVAALARLLAGLVTVVGLLSLIGYLWNASEIVTDRVAPPVAVNTALAFALMGSAVFLLALPHANTPQRRARSRLETLVLGGFVPTALFVIVGGGLTYGSGANFVQTAERVAHTQAVRAELAQLYGAVADAELAQRNFVLSGEPGFDADMQADAVRAREHATALARLVDDNPAQQALQQRLAAAVDARLASLASTSDSQRSGGDIAGRAALLADARADLMAQIRDISAQMDATENDLARSRLLTAQSQRQATLVLLLGTLLVLGVLFLLLFRSIQREIFARHAAEENLQRLNTRLEEHVAERTRELSFQQAFLRRVIDVNPSLIFAKDGQGRFVLANQALADALSTTVEALTGKGDRDFHIDTTQSDAFESDDRRVIESGQDLVIPQEPLTNAEGRTRWLSTIKRPILSPDGRTTIVLGVAIDITERKAAQDEVQRLNVDLEHRVEERTRALHDTNRKLEAARLESEAATRAKSAFLANMSHEIRTPMNAIIGLTHLMARDVRDPLALDRLGKIGNAAQHLLQVINDILDLSKIEAGKLTLEDIDFGLEAVLSRAAEMVGAKARDKGLELILDSDHLPRRLRGDPTRLSQVLINLLSNAVKFTQHGWVRVRGMPLATEGRRVHVRFEVQDTGPGIAPARQAELFKAFEQADNTTSRQHGGTGLGLALSRQIALAMGGDAGVISAPGAGSTFWFTAWLGLGDEAQDAGAGSAPALARGLRALLVDDLPEALQVIGDRLQMLGLQVDALDNGPAALAQVEAEMAAGRPYDLVVADWRMEPVDGITLRRQLQALLGDGMPPSLLVTASDDPLIRQRALEVGYDAALLKPITASSLQDTLAALLQRPVIGTPYTATRDHSVPMHAHDGAAQLGATPAETLLRKRHAGQRVLLAEDNPINREVAEELLRGVGLEVETAWDGAAAVDLATSRPYALVLMDVQMPVLDGMEATRAIRTRIGRGMPIIAMTANAFVEDQAACLAAGMNDHVAKPVDPARMYTTLLRWLPLKDEAGAVDSAVDSAVAAGAPGAPSAAAEPPAPPRASLRERLDAVEGFDLTLALRYVAGQLPALRRTLERFVSMYARGVPALLDSTRAQAGDGTAPPLDPAAQTTTPDAAQQAFLLQWRAACHSLRGALATIGATPLVKALTQLEFDLAQPDVTPAAVLPQGRQLHDDLIALVERLRAALTEDA